MTLPVTEHFGAADNTSPPNANWTNAYNGIRCVGGQGAGTVDGDGNWAYWNADVFNDAHYSKVKILSQIAGGTGVIIRYKTEGGHTYFYYASTSDDGNIYVGDFFDGAGNDWEGFSCPAPGTIIELSVDPNTPTTIYYKENGIVRKTYTGKTFTGGAPGVTTYGAQSRMDDWEGGNVAADAIGVSIPVGSSVLAGQAPVAAATANQAVSMPVGSVILAGQAPVVVLSNAINISVPVRTLSITGQAPALTASDNKNITIPVASSAIIGQAPTVAATSNTPVSVPCAGTETDLRWDPSPGATGYRIYYGTSPGSYGAPIDVGNVTSYRIQFVAPGTYYAAVKAYNNDGDSGYSNEITVLAFVAIIGWAPTAVATTSEGQTFNETLALIVGMALANPTPSISMGGSIALSAAGTVGDGSNQTSNNLLNMITGAGITPSSLIQAIITVALQSASASGSSSDMVTSNILTMAATAGMTESSLIQALSTLALQLSSQTDQSGGTAFTDTLTFGMSAGESVSYLYEMISSLILGLTSIVGESSVHTGTGTVALPGGVQITPACTLSMIASLTLITQALIDRSQSAGESGYTDILGLAATSILSPSSLASLLGVLSLPGGAGISPASQWIGSVIQTLIAEAAISQSGGTAFADTIALQTASSLAQSFQAFINRTLELAASSILTPTAQSNLVNLIALQVAGDCRAFAFNVLTSLISMGVGAQQAAQSSAQFESSLALNLAAILAQIGGIGGMMGEVLRGVAISLNARYHSQGIVGYRAEKI